MGWDLHAGEHSLHISRWCRQVNDWVVRGLPPDPDPDSIGSVDLSSELVAKANERVPKDYAKAIALGFITNPAEFSEEDFNNARDFLHDAAVAGEGIFGSY